MLSEKAFKNDPNKFAEKLFQNKKASGTPKFSASTAQQYFETTYTDANRDYEYTPLPEMVRPTLPESLFSIDCPNLGDIKHSIRKKKKQSGSWPECTHLCSLQKMPRHFEIYPATISENLENKGHSNRLGLCVHCSIIKI